MDAFASQAYRVIARLPTLQDFSIELNCETPFHANEYGRLPATLVQLSSQSRTNRKKRRSSAHGPVCLTQLFSKWRQALTQSIAPQMPHWVLLQVLPDDVVRWV